MHSFKTSTENVWKMWAGTMWSEQIEKFLNFKKVHDIYFCCALCRTDFGCITIYCRRGYNWNTHRNTHLHIKETSSSPTLIFFLWEYTNTSLLRSLVDAYLSSATRTLTKNNLLHGLYSKRGLCRPIQGGEDP